jgi:tetratricopeptide (TPR) repeat protein
MSFNARVSKTAKRIQQTGKSGALISQAGKLKRLLFFEAGKLVGCRSSLPKERLGDLLVSEGRITQEQLSLAAEDIKTGRKIGQILVARGYLKGGEIEGYVRLQILGVAASMLLEPCDRLVFSDQIPTEAATLAPVLVPELFIYASRRLENPERYCEKVLTDEFALARVDDPPVPAEVLGLSSDELSVLEIVDATSNTSEILSASQAGEKQTLRALVGFLHAGLIRRAEKIEFVLEDSDDANGEQFESLLERVHGQVQHQDHWAVLGLEHDAGYAAIEKAYGDMREQFAPAKFSHLPDGEIHEKLAFIQARAKDAFLTLSAQSQAVAYENLVKFEDEYENQRDDWERPTRPGPGLPKDSAKAKIVFRRAKESFRSKDYWDAIQLCRTAIELNEGNEADHYQLLGVALAHNPRWRKDAEKHLKIATHINPWDPRYLVTLAKFYHREGHGQRAQRILAQVKAIDPDYQIPNLEEKT